MPIKAKCTFLMNSFEYRIDDKICIFYLLGKPLKLELHPGYNSSNKSFLKIRFCLVFKLIIHLCSIKKKFIESENGDTTSVNKT